MRKQKISLHPNYRTQNKSLTVPASAIFDCIRDIKMKMPSVSVPSSNDTYVRTLAIVGELSVKSRNPNGIAFFFLTQSTIRGPYA